MTLPLYNEQDVEPDTRYIVSVITDSQLIEWLGYTDDLPEAEEWFKEAADTYPLAQTTLFDSRKNIDLMFNGEYQL